MRSFGSHLTSLVKHWNQCWAGCQGCADLGVKPNSFPVPWQSSHLFGYHLTRLAKLGSLEKPFLWTLHIKQKSRTDGLWHIYVKKWRIMWAIIGDRYTQDVFVCSFIVVVHGSSWLAGCGGSSHSQGHPVYLLIYSIFTQHWKPSQNRWPPSKAMTLKYATVVRGFWLIWGNGPKQFQRCLDGKTTRNGPISWSLGRVFCVFFHSSASWNGTNGSQWWCYGAV